MSDEIENLGEITPENVSASEPDVPSVEESDSSAPANEEVTPVLGLERPADEFPESVPAPTLEGLPTCGFVTEKNPGKGEDGAPIEFIWEMDGSRRTLIAVFDGMGGAGSRKVPDPHNPESSVSMAYLASRAARGAVLEACKQITTRMQPGEIVGLLGQNIQKFLTRLVEREGGIPSGSMRGRMVKDYPTTVAIALIEEGDSRTVHMMWAGDSRVYAMHHDQAFLLQQLTLDHTASGASGDGGDAALTRCATPDSVDLEYTTIEVPNDAIIFVATDGCFAYESSQFLLTTLIEQIDRSTNQLDYAEKLSVALSTIAGDDCAMAMSFPFEVPFEESKQKLSQHLRELQDLRNVPRNNSYVLFSSEDFFLRHLKDKLGG